MKTSNKSNRANKSNDVKQTVNPLDLAKQIVQDLNVKKTSKRASKINKLMIEFLLDSPKTKDEFLNEVMLKESTEVANDFDLTTTEGIEDFKATLLKRRTTLKNSFEQKVCNSGISFNKTETDFELIKTKKDGQLIYEVKAK